MSDEKLRATLQEILSVTERQTTPTFNAISEVIREALEGPTVDPEIIALRYNPDRQKYEPSAPASASHKCPDCGTTGDAIRTCWCWRSSIAPASAPPEWVSVPREATDEMVNVGRETWDDTQSVDSVWAAMIEAAPTSAPSCCGWKEAAKIAEAYGDRWSLKALGEVDGSDGEVACESAASSGRELAELIRARAQPCCCGELEAENEILRTSHRNMQDEISELREALEKIARFAVMPGTAASSARYMRDIALAAIASHSGESK